MKKTSVKTFNVHKGNSVNEKDIVFEKSREYSIPFSSLLFHLFYSCFSLKLLMLIINVIWLAALILRNLAWTLFCFRGTYFSFFMAHVMHHAGVPPDASFLNKHTLVLRVVEKTSSKICSSNTMAITYCIQSKFLTLTIQFIIYSTRSTRNLLI